MQVIETQYEFGQIDIFSVLQMQARSLHNEALLISMKNARIAQQRVLHLGKQRLSITNAPCITLLANITAIIEYRPETEPNLAYLKTYSVFWADLS